MNCDDARGWLLDAEPEALARMDASPVAEHLQSCAACRDAASRILAGHRELCAAYGALSPRAGAAAVVRGVRERQTVAVTALGRHRLAVAGLVSLAAAATVLIAVARRDRVPPVRQAIPPGVVADSVASAIAVDVPEGRNAIVFATRNPLISVVWIY